MADKVAAGHVGGANGAREAVCIHTKKIYSSCRDKDCIEDLRFYPTATAQSVLSTAQGLRGGSAELIYTFVDVEPVNFNRGYYTVDMHFFYRITLQALNGSTRYTEIEGLATFDKRVVLFGSESGAKIYSSIPEANAIDAPLNLTANHPTAVVEVVDPMLLCAHFADNCNCRCGCDRGTLGGVPAGILAAFDEPIIFDESAIRRVCISLGQFSTVRLERDTFRPTSARLPAATATARTRARSSMQWSSRWTISSRPRRRPAAAAARAPAANSKNQTRKNGEFPRFFFCPKRDKPA